MQQGHIGVLIILNGCKYLILKCPVTMDVRIYVCTLLQLLVPPPRPPDSDFGFLQLGVLLRTGMTLIFQHV